MGRFSKNYKILREIAVRINDNLSKCNDLNELRDDVNSFVSLFNETSLIAKKKDHIALRYLFTMINYGCLLFDEFKKLLIEYLHIDDMSAFDIWNDYVEYMILFYDFRVFNYDVIIDAAIHYLNKVKFDKEKHDLLLTRLINYHNNGIDDDYPLLDNNYNSELCKPLINFIEPALNGVELCISEEEKEARDEEFRKMVYNNFKSSYKANISIKHNDKYKMEINKKYSHKLVLYTDMVLEDLKKFDNTIKDHEYTARMLRNNPSAYNLYLYLLEVVLGYEHYTCLNSLILDVIDNVELYIEDYLCHSRDSGKFFNIICKYIMLYFGIAYPKNELKAMEYLSLNMAELIKASNYVSLLAKYMPYEIHSIISNNPTNTDEFIAQCLNPIYLNENKLIKVLDSKNEDEIYEILKDIKKSNIYIFNDVVNKYKAQYERGLEIEREKQLEKQRQEEEEKENKLKEEEKERQLQEKNDKKAKAAEKLKKDIELKSEALSEEELMELIGKTDDIKAMWDVGRHYFVLASNDFNYYNLSYHYYNIAGELGNSNAYLNAAIAKGNYGLYLVKDSDEYKENHSLVMEILGKTEHTSIFYFAYAFYAHEFKCEKYTKYIEDTYKEIFDNPKTGENSKKLLKSGYHYYNDDFYNSLYYFDEIKEFVDRAILSIFTNRIYDKIYDKTKNIKRPILKDGFINPFSDEYYEFQKKNNAFLDASHYIAKAKSMIEWASNLNDSSSVKYKAYCLYYGIMNYEKNHKEAYDILSNLEASFNANDKTYKKILDDLKLEFNGKKRK